jgi:TonB family protein
MVASRCRHGRARYSFEASRIVCVPGRSESALFHLVFALALAGAGTGAEIVPLQPSGRWTVNYQQNGCLLSRRFGPEAGSVTLGFEPSMAVAEGRLLLVVPAPEKRPNRTGKARIELAPSGMVLAADFSSGPIGPGRGIVLWLEPGSVAGLTDARTITVTAGDEPPVVLRTGGMTGALKAIRTCQDDLLRSWGVDPADMIKEEDRPAVATWFGVNSYPSSAVRAGAQGRVVSLITIGDDGKPTGCRIVITSGSSDLDKATCSIARQNARFGKVSREPKQPPRWMLLPVRWILPAD